MIVGADKAHEIKELIERLRACEWFGSRIEQPHLAHMSATRIYWSDDAPELAAFLIESLSAQVAELRRALEWIADQERYTFAECSLAEQIISTAKNVIACMKEEK